MDWVYPHIARLRRLLRRRGRSIEDTDDILQDLFVRVLSNCPSGEHIRDPAAFLARIALNLSTNAYAREHRELYTAKPADEVCVTDRSLAPDELVDCSKSL